MPAELRRRVGVAEQILASAWQSESPWAALPAALGSLFPGSTSVCYGPPSPQLPAWFITDVQGELRCDSQRIRHLDRLPSIRRYQTGCRDPYANRPMNFATIYAEDDGLDAALDGILKPNGLDHQLRTVIYQDDKLLGYVGVYRERIEMDAVLDEHALFHAAGDALRTWLGNLEALGMHPMGEDAVSQMLEAFEEPAYLLHGRNIALANTRARDCTHEALEWLPDMDEAVRRGRIRRTNITLQGRTYGVVVDRTPRCTSFDALPPALRTVALALAAGEADKEIVARTGYSLATVRTYAQRVLERLNVRSRRDVMLLARK